jgi:hypothetical protein
MGLAQNLLCLKTDERGVKGEIEEKQRRKRGERRKTM